MVSLAAVFPFLAVLNNPVEFFQRPIIQNVGPQFGINSSEQLRLTFTIIFGLAALIAAFIRLASYWLSINWSAEFGSFLSCEAYRRSLYQPYKEQIKQNSSELISAISIHIGGTIGFISNFLRLITSVVVLISILITILIIDWQVAIGACLVFGSIYLVVVFFTKRLLVKNGILISRLTASQLKALQEGLGAIRDVLLSQTQPHYIDIYRRSDVPLRKKNAQNTFLGVFPRYLMEGLGLFLIALMGYLLVGKEDLGFNIIPLLGSLALASARLLPATQLIYFCYSAIQTRRKSVEIIIKLLSLPLPLESCLSISNKLPLVSGINFQEVDFSYSDDNQYVLRKISFSIGKGERIGFVGRTGSGKSTTVDLLMGLLEPTSGHILVDGEDIHRTGNESKLIAWRAGIAHVPQNIYLADTTIEENIALGIPYNEINFEKVREAAMQAQVSQFIESSIDGYKTYVGERGVRLSGGQRQRLGIARALYKNSNIIVFDEATSALDNRTEAQLMLSIEAMRKELTIIMIAHRLTTLSNCDKVFLLENGKIDRVISGNDVHSISENYP